MGRGGVLNSPRFWVFFVNVESWATAHGWYRCAVYRLLIWALSEPMSTRLLNSISSGICRQNTQFNMYTSTSKQQEGCTFKDSHPKCFITANFDKFHREAVAKGDESRWSFDSVFPSGRLPTKTRKTERGEFITPPRPNGQAESLN